MNTPSGSGRPAAPVPPAPQVPGLPTDPHAVERMANAFFREAFSMPVTTPAQLPPPTESSAVVPLRGLDAPPGAAAMPGGFASAPTGASAAQGVGPILAPTPTYGAVPGHAPSPTPSLAPPPLPAPGPTAFPEALGLLPPFGSLTPTGFALPPLAAGGLSFDTALPPLFPPPSAPGAAAAPGSAPTSAMSPPAMFPSAGSPTAAAAPPAPPAADAPTTPDDSPYWLAAAAQPPPAPGCRRARDIEQHMMADALGSAPQLASPGEAEAERQTSGRGLASPSPSLERLFADAARFAWMPMGSESPPATFPAAFPTTPPMGLRPRHPTSTTTPPPPPPASAAAAPTRGAPGVPRLPSSSGAFDVETVRRDFPALRQEVHGRPLIWLDNAATTQKPQAVIDAISRYYARDNSNIHRGAHELARRATEAYENARDVVRRFLNASSAEEIVFTRGTTEAINLVAQSWGRQNLRAGDEIILTTLEHHANIVPWQFVAREKGAVLKVVPMTDRGEVILEEYARLLGPRTKLVAVTQVSNALGTVVPVREMATLAHRHDVPILVDGAQSVPHMRADVQDLGADFFVFSGHKVFGPTGIGALYARKALLETMPPWQGGGSMIRTVTFEQSTFSDPPAKFEAGTPNIADAVGLAAALEYVERLGIDLLERYEHDLLVYAEERMKEVPGLRPIGTAPHKASVLSFVFDGVRVEDVGRYLDAEGIAVRAGHHCAMPSLARLGLTGTVRPSLAFYNTRGEVDRLVEVLKRFRQG